MAGAPAGGTESARTSDNPSRHPAKIQNQVSGRLNTSPIAVDLNSTKSAIHKTVEFGQGFVKKKLVVT